MHKCAWVWTKSADEMDWLQRWLFVTCDVISFHLDQDSAPTRFLAVHRCTITDSGSVEFAIEWNEQNDDEVGATKEGHINDEETEDNRRLIEVRCCDRQECSEFLDSLHRVEVIPAEKVDASVQTDLSWKDIVALLHQKDETIANLKLAHEQELLNVKERLTSENRKTVAALEARCSRLLDSEVRREETLRTLREEMLGAMRRIQELESEAAQIDLLQQLLTLRQEHASWLHHHLCAEQIARFGLALKRAGQVCSKIRGCDQMSAEFSRAWPIVEHLVELPRRLIEEEQLLRRVVKKKHAHPKGIVGSVLLGAQQSNG